MSLKERAGRCRRETHPRKAGTSGLLRMKQGWACGQDTGEVCASLWPATWRAGPPKLPGILKSPGGQLETLAGSPPTPEGTTPPPAGNHQDERRTSSPGPQQEEEEEEKQSNRKSEVFQQQKSHGGEGSPSSAASPSEEGPPQVIKAIGGPPSLVPTRRAQPVDPTPGF